MQQSHQLNVNTLNGFDHCGKNIDSTNVNDVSSQIISLLIQKYLFFIRFAHFFFITFRFSTHQSDILHLFIEALVKLQRNKIQSSAYFANKMPFIHLIR